jgi:hypothetical protein
MAPVPPPLRSDPDNAVVRSAKAFLKFLALFF